MCFFYFGDTILKYTHCTYLGRQAVQSVIHANNSVTTTVLFEVQSDQGYLSDFTWSPDGTALAFTNYRGDHSFVGIFTSSTSPLQWLNPSFDVDSSPAWSPGYKCC
jgi:Tol biopolymer transport system component